jgi:hypothetical protein
MKKLLLVVVVLLSLGLSGTVLGKSSYQDDDDLKVEAERGFGEILDLWRDGKYEALYDRTEGGGTVTREDFVGRLAKAPYRPVCCWEKLQEVRVVLKNDDTARIRAKVGLEGNARNFTSTRDYRLVREDGVWRIAMKDILSMAGGSKSKVHRARKQKKKKHF